MDDLNDLYYFARVVEHGGFAAAGRALGIPKSRLSRRLAALEERLGVRLINRSTRRFSTTEIGATFYRHCRGMLVEASAAREVIDAARAEPAGMIRLSCPITLLHVHIGGFLAGFMTRYPRVEVDLEATNRRVDVIHEGMDLAIRVRPPPLEDSDLVMRVLSERRLGLFASPELVARWGKPDGPEALSRWPSLSISDHGRRYRWSLSDDSNRRVEVMHKPRFVTSDMIALRRAAVAGLGVVQLPLLTVRRQLDDGRLVELMPQWCPPPDIVHVVFPSKRGLLPAVRTLIDELVDFYRSFDEL